jgi:hypothetical protein
MVFVGLAGLFLTIGLPFLLFGSIESVEQLLDVGFAIYFVLPLVGAFWILRATWNELFPLREPRKELSACAERATPFSSDPKHR